MEQLTKLKDEKENDYLNQIEDLTAQVSLFINRLKLNWSILFSITLSKLFIYRNTAKLKILLVTRLMIALINNINLFTAKVK